MELQGDSLDPVIEDIAALLATGYLRLCTTRSRTESAIPAALQSTDERLDRAGDPSLRGAMSVTSHEKGD